MRACLAKTDPKTGGAGSSANSYGLLLISRAPPCGGPTHRARLARPTRVPQCAHKQVWFREKQCAHGTAPAGADPTSQPR